VSGHWDAARSSFDFSREHLFLGEAVGRDVATAGLATPPRGGTDDLGFNGFRAACPLQTPDGQRESTMLTTAAELLSSHKH
jgi:hypothetical protein